MLTANPRTSLTCGLLVTLASTAIVTGAYPADPDNAALLYYQAFIMVPRDTDQGFAQQMVDGLPDLTDPNQQVPDYLAKAGPAIELAMAASGLE